MIQILTPVTWGHLDQLGAKNLIGRIVLEGSGHQMWKAVSSAMRVTEVSGSTLIGHAVKTIYDCDKSEYVANNRDSDEEDRTKMKLSSVRAVCDSVREVVALRNLDLQIQGQFNTFRRFAAEALRGMHGKDVPDPVA